MAVYHQAESAIESTLSPSSLARTRRLVYEEEQDESAASAVSPAFDRENASPETGSDTDFAEDDGDYQQREDGSGGVVVSALDDDVEV